MRSAFPTRSLRLLTAGEWGLWRFLCERFDPHELSGLAEGEGMLVAGSAPIRKVKINYEPSQPQLSPEQAWLFDPPVASRPATIYHP